MPTPTWQAPTTGQVPLATHVNQLLGVHNFTALYAAVQKAGQTTLGATASSTATTYLAQSFTTAVGQTTVGYISAPITSNTVSGTNLATTTLGLYASSGTAPTGSAINSVTITTEYAYGTTGAGTTNVSTLYPLPTTGLTASTQYWLVLKIAGTPSNHYSWFQSNQVSGASTSPDGTTWTAQGFGFVFQVFDQTASGLLTAIWDDGGARWSTFTSISNSAIDGINEYTAGQTTSGYIQSVRLASYSNGFLTGVA